MADDCTALPLEGIKVLDLGHTVMGPTTGLILADMGADVLKIERAPGGDTTRTLTGFGAGFFPYLNRNKASLAIDLKSEQGAGVLRRLIAGADVLIENFGPGAMERLGFGYEACAAANPALIYCALKGFLPGPYEDRPALDEVVQMMGGLAYMTGPSGRPLRAGASVVDILGGTFGAVGILAALHRRKITGEGECVHAALYESVAFLMGQHMAVAAVTGEPPPPMPERGRSWSVYDLFETVDGQEIFIGCTSDAHWQALCTHFDFADWQADPRLADNTLRVAARDWLLPTMRRRIGRLRAEEVQARALRAGIPFAPVGRPQDLFDDPHLNQSGGLCEVRLPDGGTTRLPKLPLRLGRAEFDLRKHPPQIGEGSRAFLLAAGLADAEIEELRAAGVLLTDGPIPSEENDP
ncbi:MAG: CaiB/BaiF CoA-transferase family protein [Desulfobacterales bacterium]|nr:CaiB/BaiF CoA-transferase family protein [Desulfobacterales bacterium]